MRNQTRRELTKLSYRAMWGILGRGAPRRLRRHFGRLYAKEAYRQHKGLPLRYTQGSALVDMIVNEYVKTRESAARVAAEEASAQIDAAAESEGSPNSLHGEETR